MSCGECSDEEKNRFEEQEEEAEKIKRRKGIKGPTSEEIRQHNVTHLPYRAWCPWCVGGRGKDDAHHGKEGDDEDKKEAHFDYAFPRNESGGDWVPMLVGRSRNRKFLVAHVVPMKGASHEWVVKQTVKDLRRMGFHSKVLLKTDQEPALVDLMKEVAEERNADTVLEESPVGDSKGNGFIERGVQQVEEILRVHKLRLEARIGERISVTHPVFAWLVEHVADVINKCLVSSDGKTAFERVKGKKHHGEMVEFATPILHRVAGKVHGGVMAERWLDGLWLGKCFETGEHIVSMTEGQVVRARAIKEKPTNTELTKEMLDTVKGLPWMPTGTVGEAARPVLHRAVPLADENPEEQEAQPRSVKIRRAVLEKVGYSRHCPKCRAVQRGDTSRATVNHTPECRKRVEEEMSKDEHLKKEVEAAKERKSRWKNKEAEEDEAPKEQGGEAKRTKQENPATPSVTQEETVGEHQAETATAQASSSSSSSGPVATPAPAPPHATISTSTSSGRKRLWVAGEDDEEPPTHYRQTEESKKREREEQTEQRTPRPKTRAAEDAPMLSEMAAWMAGAPGPQACNIAVPPVPQPGQLQEAEYEVSELFSPPRVSKRAREVHGLRGGWSFDVRAEDPVTGERWDLLQRRRRIQARGLLRETGTELLVCSPPCTAFSALQNLNPGSMTPQKMEEAVSLVKFSMQMCRQQMDLGRYFVYEHPLGASSWKLAEVRDLLHDPRVFTSEFHMCEYGLTSTDPDGRVGPVMKPTRILTNDPGVAGALRRRCQGDHKHVVLLGGGRAGKAAEYSKEFVDAIIKGFTASRKRREEGQVMAIESEDMCEKEETISWEPQDWDEKSGEPLDPVKVAEGCAEELKTFKEMGVYEYVRRSKAEADKGGKIVGVKWVKTNKGTAEDPEVRCRLVAQEFASNDYRDDLFAGTPPLAAMRMLLSEAASRGREGVRKTKLMVLDIKKAFLYGEMRRSVYIELPPEDPRSEGGQYVGKLRRAMYGTRDAPAEWQNVVTKVMKQIGFIPSGTAPCLYFHPVRDLRVIVHVDDFLCSGESHHLCWLKAALEKKFSLKTSVLGSQPEEKKEVKFLNRLIRWTPEGLEVEGDPRHAQTLLEEWEMTECKPVETPGVKKAAATTEREEMSPAEATRYRRAAARVTYMAQDRPDLAFAAKELAKNMARPKCGDEVEVKRVIRYLRGRPRGHLSYPWQERNMYLNVFTDSDWAGDVVSRRSTSGGLVQIGRHTVHHWSRTQAQVALSSGEAELNGSVKGASEGIGLQRIAASIGIKLALRLLGDSSAAKGILMRKGAGPIKHLATKQLWVQELVERKEAEAIKINRSVNLADCCTHHWNAEEGGRHLRSLGFRVASEGGCWK